MTAAVASFLALADLTLPKGRQTLIDELADLISDKKYYTAKEVADMYKVSPNGVKHWETIGKLIPSLKIPGGTVRYSLADLNRFEESQKKYRGRKEEE